MHAHVFGYDKYGVPTSLNTGKLRHLTNPGYQCYAAQCSMRWDRFVVLMPRFYPIFPFECALGIGVSWSFGIQQFPFSLT